MTVLFSKRKLPKGSSRNVVLCRLTPGVNFQTEARFTQGAQKQIYPLVTSASIVCGCLLRRTVRPVQEESSGDFHFCFAIWFTTTKLIFCAENCSWNFPGISDREFEGEGRNYVFVVSSLKRYVDHKVVMCSALYKTRARAMISRCYSNGRHYLRSASRCWLCCSIALFLQQSGLLDAVPPPTHPGKQQKNM